MGISPGWIKLGGFKATSFFQGQEQIPAVTVGRQLPETILHSCQSVDGCLSNLDSIPVENWGLYSYLNHVIPHYVTPKLGICHEELVTE